MPVDYSLSPHLVSTMSLYPLTSGGKIQLILPVCASGPAKCIDRMKDGINERKEHRAASDLPTRARSDEFTQMYPAIQIGPRGTSLHCLIDFVTQLALHPSQIYRNWSEATYASTPFFVPGCNCNFRPSAVGHTTSYTSIAAHSACTVTFGEKINRFTRTAHPMRIIFHYSIAASMVTDDI